MILLLKVNVYKVSLTNSEFEYCLIKEYVVQDIAEEIICLEVDTDRGILYFGG